MSSRSSWSFKDSTVGQSYAWSLALSLLPVLAAFISSWIIARFSGPTVWGTVSWAMAFATQLLIVAKVGIELGASKLASEYGVSQPGVLRDLLRIASNIRLAFTLPTALICYFFAPQIANLFHNPDLVSSVRIAAAIIFCASIYEFQEQFLVGLNRFATVSRVRATMLFARLVSNTAIVVIGMGAVAILVGYVGAWLIGIAAFSFLLRRYLPPTQGHAEHKPIRRRLLAMTLPLAVSSASVAVYTQIDKLVLGYFDNVVEVGQYSIARAVMEVSLFPTFAMVTTLRPALAARYARGEKRECARIVKRSLLFTLVSGVLFGSVFLVLSVPLLQLVYSSKYHYAGQLMTWFSAVILIRSLGALVLPALLAADRIKTYAWLTAGAAVLNLILNVVLIPHMHSRGAIISTIVSYGLLLVLGLREVFDVFDVRLHVRSIGRVLRTLLAGGLVAAMVWLVIHQVPADKWGWTIGLATAHVVIYAVLIFAFRVVHPAEIRPMMGNLLRVKG
ncbi:MAG TPA: oligosaccharide flippase family protein [Candidatus Krumholzibacteria bacterium]|nr:oligosaccharide flippase family protein [Candidatus Krumholzibacteria bacterium]